MSTPIRPRGTSRLAWLALSGLGVIAFVLGAGAWVALRAENWGRGPQRLVDACLLFSQSVAEGVWSWTTTNPLTALVLAFLAASMLWALVRLSLSLLASWRVGIQLTVYEAGRFPRLDQALRLCPEIEPARIRVIRSITPEAFTIGLVRPKVCLSVGLLQSMTETEISGVLRHEHGHVAARDPIRLAAVRLLSDFLWFLPIARTLAEAFSGLAEFRADDAAVLAGSDSLELASAIVKTAGGASSGPRLAPALGSLALVEQRVIRLLGRERTIRVAIPWGPALASGLMIVTLVAFLIAPAFGTGRAPDSDPMVAMHSMMSKMMADCASGDTVSAGLMTRCGDSGTSPHGVRRGPEN